MVQLQRSVSSPKVTSTRLRQLAITAFSRIGRWARWVLVGGVSTVVPRPRLYGDISDADRRGTGGPTEPFPVEARPGRGDHVVRLCSWWRRTRAAAVMAPIRQGHRLTRRSALKVVLSSELPRSVGARVNDVPNLTPWRAVRDPLPGARGPTSSAAQSFNDASGRLWPILAGGLGCRQSRSRVPECTSRPEACHPSTGSQGVRSRRRRDPHKSPRPLAARRSRSPGLVASSLCRSAITPTVPLPQKERTRRPSSAPASPCDSGTGQQAARGTAHLGCTNDLGQ
jgi:hypothetical protein